MEAHDYEAVARYCFETLEFGGVCFVLRVFCYYKDSSQNVNMQSVVDN